jgi:hypothetical protein
MLVNFEDDENEKEKLQLRDRKPKKRIDERIFRLGMDLS